MSPADYIVGLSKGLAVLESFDTERQRLSASVAAQRTGITRAAARRHLLTLASMGYLETDGSHFWMTAKILRFSGSYLASARLPRVVQPTLNRLAIQIGESLSAVVLDGDEVVIIGRSGPTRLLAYGLHLGARLPAHATSTGRVLLAAMPKKGLDAWIKGRDLRRLTPHTIVDTGEFKREVDKVRKEDFCVADQEHELGVLALAVPVRDSAGRVVAALNIVLSSKSRPTAERLKELVFYLQDGASELRGLL
ncbi:MAG: IclR family transcriptional regulator [Comamonadaceae bacterium]|nr:MAG: IclR family transcriptional regulator [Comamonadaceae bacterium]